MLSVISRIHRCHVESISEVYVCYLWICHVFLPLCRSWSWWRACITNWPVRNTSSWRMMWVATILCSALFTLFVLRKALKIMNEAQRLFSLCTPIMSCFCLVGFLFSKFKYSFVIFCIYILLLLILSALQDIVKYCALFLKRSILLNLVYFK